MDKQLPIIGNKTKKDAMLVATNNNLRRLVDQVIGIINAHSVGDMTEEESLTAIDELYGNYARLIVEDLTHGIRP